MQKLSALQSESDIQRLIADGTEETLTLEYKAADSLQKDDTRRAEITKDVSAMANSAGGVIIYGVREFRDPREKRHLPERIDPVDRTAFTREWLDQVISTIQPRLEFTITAIPLASSAAHAVYVVEVPQSSTAHQSRDGRYWKRSNTTVRYMEDYEVRDVFNRQKHPVLTATFAIDQPEYDAPLATLATKERGWRLTMHALNEGPVYVKYVLGAIVCDPRLIHKTAIASGRIDTDRGRRVFVKEGRNQEIFGILKSDRSYEPILPSLARTLLQVRLAPNWEKLNEHVVQWYLFGDSAPRRVGHVALTELIKPSQETSA